MIFNLKKMPIKKAPLIKEPGGFCLCKFRNYYFVAGVVVVVLFFAFFVVVFLPFLSVFVVIFVSVFFVVVVLFCANATVTDIATKATKRVLIMFFMLI